MSTALAQQLELPPLQEHGRSSHVTRPRMLHWRPGYCAVTGDSEELPLSASCTNGTSGSWTLAANEKASWDTALHACALRCHADARGRHGWSAGRAQAEPGLQHIWLRQPLTRGGLRPFPELYCASTQSSSKQFSWGYSELSREQQWHTSAPTIHER